jgi:hypothetical protein
VPIISGFCQICVEWSKLTIVNLCDFGRIVGAAHVDFGDAKDRRQSWVEPKTVRNTVGIAGPRTTVIFERPDQAGCASTPTVELLRPITEIDFGRNCAHNSGLCALAEQRAHLPVGPKVLLMSAAKGTDYCAASLPSTFARSIVARNASSDT